MLAGFLMHDHLVCARVDEDGCVLVRIGDHQVFVQRQPRDFANGGHHRRPDRQVGHEVAVHHVQMQHGGAAPLYLGDLDVIVRLGTKWPSITSRCSMVAPPRSTWAICSPRRAKSAARIDGRISIICGISPILPRGAGRYARWLPQECLTVLEIPDSRSFAKSM